MRKTISLAMTTYNGEKYLREQLDSIYNQTLVPDEVIVCDDNSKDGTVAILKEYGKTKGLKYYVNNPGLGVNKNFFKAISLCLGDYICLSDQDDIWLPTKIETLYSKLCEIDKGTPCAVSSQCDDIDSEGRIISRKSPKEDTTGYATSLLGTGIGQGCTMMFNKELANLVLNYLSQKPLLNDIMFDALISHFAAVFGVKYNLMSSLMLYRHHTGNVLANAEKLIVTRRQRVKNYGTFVGFITDKRIVFLSKIFTCCKKEIENKDIYLLLEKIAKMNSSKSFVRKQTIMLTIKELSITKRISILSKSCCIYMLKKIV